MRSLVATADVALLRGRWLRLRYSQSFRGQPARPLLRLTLADGTVEEHILPAAVLGRARWIGWAPATLARLDLSADLPDAAEFRLDAMLPCRTAPLLWQGVRRQPSGLVDVALWPWKDCRARRLSLQRLLDLEPLARIGAFAAERSRPLEPDGLDRGLTGPEGDAVVVEFVIAAEPDTVAGLQETLAALAASRDVPGWRVTIVGGPGDAITALVRAAGLDPIARHSGAAQPRVPGGVIPRSPRSGRLEGGTHVQRASRRGLATAPQHDAVGRARSGPTLDIASASSAPFVGLLRPADRLRPEAIPILIDALLREPGLRLLYADSALADPDGHVTAPELKPDWSPDFLAHADYIGRPSLVRTDILRAIVGQIAADEPHPWWRVSQLAGAAGTPDGVRHLRRLLLLHRPDADALPSPSWGGVGGGGPSGPTPEFQPARPPPRSSASLRLGPPRKGEGRCASEDLGPHQTSIVIPSKNRVELLRRAVESVRRFEAAGSHEFVIVDNGSDAPEARAYLDGLRGEADVTVVDEPGPFNFSRLVNRGVAAARHPVVVLLNNDCELLHAGTLGRLAALAGRPGIGAVGARLLYADGTLQHAGIGIGLGGFAGHRDRGAPRGHPGHLGRLRVPHEVSAVTAACLAVRRETYLAAGGFDEAFAVAFNDVDFCLRLDAMGLRTILAADVELRHAESASRGRDAGGAKRARFEAEAARFAGRWRHRIQDDPYTHPLFATDRFSDRLG